MNAHLRTQPSRSTAEPMSSTGIGTQRHQGYTPASRLSMVASFEPKPERALPSRQAPASSRIAQDSGAFSDSPGQRLDYGAALDRQQQHAERYGYANQIGARASYDLLIDEKWSVGQRHKARWTESEADDAVEQTIAAAAFLDQHRDGLPAVMSAQGVNAQQYLRCTQRILRYLRPAQSDILGLGGWCITGMMPTQIMPSFRETMQLLIPFLGREGIRRVHVWGVCYARASGLLLRLCDEWSIALSTDSAGPNIRPNFGRWGYAEWHNPRYARVPVETRGLERAKHVALTRAWLAQFRETQHYQTGDA